MSAQETWWTGEPVRRLERSLLGSVLILGELLPKVRAVLAVEDFEAETHRTIYRALLRVYTAAQTPDLVLVADELHRSGDIERAGGLAYLTGLVDDIPSVDHTTYYAKRLKECAALRSVHRRRP